MFVRNFGPIQMVSSLKKGFKKGSNEVKNNYGGIRVKVNLRYVLYRSKYEVSSMFL